LKHLLRMSFATSFSFTDRRHEKGTDRGRTCMLSIQSSSHAHKKQTTQTTTHSAT
jgi:hypothetical protein